MIVSKFDVRPRPEASQACQRGLDAKKQEQLNKIHDAPAIGGHLPGRPDVLIRC
jgi:hypothetical protein